MTIPEIEVQLLKLQDELAVLKKEGSAKDWPQQGDDYWRVNTVGIIVESVYVPTIDYDNETKEYGNCFRTEQEAYRRKMQIESMKRPEWVPKDSDDYYCWDVFRSNAVYHIWDSGERDFELFNLGRVFKTGEEARAHYDKYAQYWTEIN